MTRKPEPMPTKTTDDTRLMTAGQRAKAVLLAVLVGTLFAIAVPTANTASGVMVGAAAGLAYAFVVGVTTALRGPNTKA